MRPWLRAKLLVSVLLWAGSVLDGQKRGPVGPGPEGGLLGESGRAPAPGGPRKLPERQRCAEPPPPTATLLYCPLLWPRTVHPAAPLSSLPLALLPNSPVPYCPPQGRYSGFPWWQKYCPPRPCSRDPPTYCPV